MIVQSGPAPVPRPMLANPAEADRKLHVVKKSLLGLRPGRRRLPTSTVRNRSHLGPLLETGRRTHADDIEWARDAYGRPRP